MCQSSKEPLFDNQNHLLRSEFMSLEEVASFLKHSEMWVIHKVNEGIIPCYSVGKTQRFFHVDDLRNAILQNSLALQGGNYDQESNKQKRSDNVRSQSQEMRACSLTEIRQQKKS